MNAATTEAEITITVIHNGFERTSYLFVPQHEVLDRCYRWRRAHKISVAGGWSYSDREPAQGPARSFVRANQSPIKFQSLTA